MAAELLHQVDDLQRWVEKPSSEFPQFAFLRNTEQFEGIQSTRGTRVYVDR